MNLYEDFITKYPAAKNYPKEKVYEYLLDPNNMRYIYPALENYPDEQIINYVKNQFPEFSTKKEKGFLATLAQKIEPLIEKFREKETPEKPTIPLKVTNIPAGEAQAPTLTREEPQALPTTLLELYRARKKLSPEQIEETKELISYLADKEARENIRQLLAFSLAGSFLSPVTAKIAGKVAPAVSKIPKVGEFLSKITPGIVEGGMVFPTATAATELIKKIEDENYEWKDVLKNIGYSIPEGIIIGGIISSIPALASTIKGRIRLKKEIIPKAAKTLGVKKTDINTVTKRYRELAKIYHPDVPNTGNIEKFREITEAYQTLVKYNKIAKKIKLPKTVIEKKPTEEKPIDRLLKLLPEPKAPAIAEKPTIEFKEMISKEIVSKPQQQLKVATQILNKMPEIKEGAVEAGGISGVFKKAGLQSGAVDKVIKNATEVLVNNPDDPTLTDTSIRLFKRLTKKLALGEFQFGDVPAILRESGLSTEQFAKWFRSEISEWGRGLGKLGHFAKQFNIQFKKQVEPYFQQIKQAFKGNKEAIKIINTIQKHYPTEISESLLNRLNQIAENPAQKEKVNKLIEEYNKIKELSKEFKKYEKELTLWDKIKEIYRKADNVRRGMLVGQIMTAIRNAEVQFARYFMDTVENAMVGAFLKIKHPTIASKKAYAGMFANIHNFIKGLSPTGRKEIEKLLDNFPVQKAKLLSTTGQALVLGNKLVKIINTLNTLQEHFFRRISAAAKAEALVTQKGANSIEELSSIDRQEIGDKIVNHALDLTFAKYPEKGVGQAIMRLYREFPFLTLVAPFPRFAYNIWNFIVNYNPIGFARLFSKSFKTKLASPDITEKTEAYKTFNKALIGSLIFAYALLLRSKRYRGPKYYQVKFVDKDGKTKVIDLRPFAPFAQYMFFAELVLHGTKNISGRDWTDALLSVNRLAGSGLLIIDALRAKAGRTGKITSRIVLDVLGEWLAGFTVPFRTLIDLLSGIIPEEKFYRDIYTYTRSPLKRQVGRIIRNIPLLRELLPRKVALISEKEKYLKRTTPYLRQLTGLSIQELEPIQEEMLKYGLEINDIVPRSTKIAELDQLILFFMQDEFKKRIKLFWPAYQQIKDEDRKEDFLRKFFSNIRQAAKRRAYSARPDLYRKFLELKREKKNKKTAKKETPVDKLIALIKNVPSLSQQTVPEQNIYPILPSQILEQKLAPEERIKRAYKKILARS